MSKGVLEHTFKGMYVAPVLTGKSTSPGIQQYWLFLERNGTHLIRLEATEATAAAESAKEFADLNEIRFLGEPHVVGDIVFLCVDPAKTDLGAFYSWREVTAATIPSKEVWRPFLWVSSAEQTDPLGVNKMLEGITIAEAPHTVFRTISAFNTLRAAHTNT